METSRPPQTKLVLFGGFLGAGKTTLMAELGRRFVASGRSVALITNDQGAFLVDTRFARSAGFCAAEVLNGCFCCRFPDLVGSIRTIIEGERPRYIFAEPVGSCTDLRATVLAPLRRFHGDTVRLGPLVVLVDAPRLAGEYGGMNLEEPREPKEVLVSHQLREADVLLLSKSDLVPEGGGAARRRLRRLNPAAILVRCSVRSGEGLEQIASIVERGEPGERRAVDLDYELYARAEAEQGWYNGSWEMHGEGAALALMSIALELLRSFSTGLPGLEVTHAKVHVLTEAGAFKVSSVMGLIEVDGQPPPSPAPGAACFTLNVRARTDPATISEHVRESLSAVAAGRGAEVRDYREEVLVPAAPRPTYRLT